MRLCLFFVWLFNLFLPFFLVFSLFFKFVNNQQVVVGGKGHQLLLSHFILNFNWVCWLKRLKDYPRLRKLCLNLFQNYQKVIHFVFPLSINSEPNKNKPEKEEPLLLFKIFYQLLLQLWCLEPKIISLLRISSLLCLFLCLLKLFDNLRGVFAFNFSSHILLFNLSKSFIDYFFVNVIFVLPQKIVCLYRPEY